MESERLHGIQWNPMEFYRIQMNPERNLMESYEIKYNPKGTLTNSMESLWESYGVLRKSNRILRNLMEP